MSVKGFTYQIDQEEGIFSFAADAGENTNVWFKKYSTPSAFEAEESSFGSSWSWMGNPGAVEAPNSGTLNPETGALISVHQVPNSTSSPVTTRATPAGNVKGITWDGEYFWLTDSATDTIYKTDTSFNQQAKFSSPTSNVQGLGWDGQYLWISNVNGNPTLYQTDPSTGNAISTFNVPFSNVGVCWNGNYLYLGARASGSGGIYKFKADGTQVDHINTGTRMHSVGFDGMYIWAIDTNNNQIERYTESGTKVSEFANISDFGTAWTGEYLVHAGSTHAYRLGGPASLDISYRVNSIV